MQHQKYNGWTNYETWCVALWLDNDQGSYNYWLERAEEIYTDTSEDDAKEERTSEACNSLAEEIKSSLESQAEEILGRADLFADLLNSALSEANYYEIAEHYIESAIDNIEA